MGQMWEKKKQDKQQKDQMRDQQREEVEQEGRGLTQSARLTLRKEYFKVSKY